MTIRQPFKYQTIRNIKYQKGNLVKHFKTKSSSKIDNLLTALKPTIFELYNDVQTIRKLYLTIPRPFQSRYLVKHFRSDK